MKVLLGVSSRSKISSRLRVEAPPAICPSQEKIIQFRLKPLDEGVLALAHKIYGDLVPSTMSFRSYALPVYVCPVIPGQVHMHLQKFPKGGFPLQRQLTTVTELAQFVAKSAFWPQLVSTYSLTSCTKTARSTLEMLTQNDSLRKLEPRFVNKASSLLESFPSRQASASIETS